MCLMNCELMLTYDTPALRQTGSRNLMGPKTLPTIWGTYMKLVTKYQISAINSCRFLLPVCRFCWFLYTFNIHLYMHIFRCIFLSNYWWQESDIWSQASYRYAILWIWWVQTRFPRYGVSIWSLWPNIRFLPSIVAEKNAMKNILDGRKDRGKASYRYSISWEAFLHPSDSYFLFADFVDFYTHLTYICICTFFVAFF
jgi:hypothetical protein